MSRFFHGRKAMAILSSVDDDPTFPVPPMSNRRQIVLFVVLTLALTAASVWAARVWFKNTYTLTFAVGSDNGVEARFAAKLATVLANNASSLRLKIVKNADNDKAITQFDKKQADLVVLRTDAKIPARARSVAILDQDLMLLLSPKNRPIASLAALKGKKIAVLGDERNAVVLRRMLEAYDIPSARMTLVSLPANATLEQLFKPGEYGAVVAIEHLSKISRDKSYERFLRGPVGFRLNEISEAKAIARKLPGVSEESFEAGLLSASPKVPDEESDTVGLQWLLVAQSGMSEQKGTELARVMLENKADLALDDGFATKIEPADTDKDAFIAAHRGAAQYIDDDTRSFTDRYSDVIYIGMAALSIIGSMFLGVYTAFTRVAPEKAGALATALLDVGEKIDNAKSIEVLEDIQDELESILRQMVTGLRDGTISGDGLDTFRLGYDFVRDSLDLRRDSLMRRAGRDEPVMMVTKAAC